MSASTSALHPIFEQALRGAAPQSLADTKIQEAGYEIHYRIEGTLEQVQCAITGIFRDYPAVGYQTRVRDLQVIGFSERYVGLVTRHRSCE